MSFALFGQILNYLPPAALDGKGFFDKLDPQSIRDCEFQAVKEPLLQSRQKFFFKIWHKKHSERRKKAAELLSLMVLFNSRLYITNSFAAT